jgi:hypothetical protein
MASSPSSPFNVPANQLFPTATSPFGGPEESAEDQNVTQAGPTLDASEVESIESAVEVVVRWGGDILHVDHLTPARAFFVGETGDADVLVPADKLGAARAALVSVDGNRVCAVVLPGAAAKISVAGRTMDLKDGVSEGLAFPSATMPGAFEIPLALGTRVHSELAGFSFDVSCVNAGRKVAGKVGGDKKAFGGQALSIAIHGAIVATMFAFMPALSSTDDTQIDQEQMYTLQAAMEQVEAERERELKENSDAKSEPEQAMTPAPAADSKDHSKAGSSTSTATNKRAAVSTDQKERSMSRAQALEDARHFGMIDLIGTLNSPAANSGPTWGDVASGPDATNANGGHFGDPGDSFGWGGTELSGTGEHGGGPGGGKWLGTINTMNGGNGNCVGAFCGNGNTAFLGSKHKPAELSIRPKNPTTSGRIPPEVIQRVIRQSFGRFRGCYEAGIRTNPNLAGRVAVSFTIGRDGAVGMVQNAGSDLPDAAVVSCVVKSFYGLSFPAPSEGTVNVTYPIAFSPSSN